MFKKLLKALVKILVIVAVIIIVIASVVLSGGSALAFLIPLGLEASMFLWIGIGLLALAFMVDKDTASEVLGNAIEGISGVVSGVIGGVTTAVGTAAKSVVDQFWWVIPLGLGAVYMYTQVKGDGNDN